MDPKNNPSNNHQRKIVFNAPGTQYGVTSGENIAQPSAINPTMPVVPEDDKGPNVHEYNQDSVTADKKDSTTSDRLHSQLPGQIKATPLVPGLNPNSGNPAFRSYAHDIKENVSDKGVSMAQIVMEEERKKQMAGATSQDIEEAHEKSGVIKTVLIIVGIIAIIGGGIAIFITFRSIAPVDQIARPEDFSPIRAQRVAVIELRDGYKNTLIQAFNGVAATRIMEETFIELKLRETIGTTSAPVGFSRMMEILDTRIPSELLRAAGETYVLGMYGGREDNVPFLLFSVDAFENGYVGMTSWERTMLGDVGGLFIDQDALSVIIASSSSSLFQDKVYYNKDTRVVLGSDGSPLIVWAIVNRTQIVITRDGETLNALINRMTLENITR